MMFVRTLVLCTRSYNEMTVLTPRVDLVALDMHSSHEQILDCIKSCTHSRLPVYEGSIDNIIGVLQIRKYIKAWLREGTALDIRPLLDDVCFVHQSTKIDELLPIMSKTHAARLRLDGRQPHRASQSHADRQSLPFPDPRRRAGKRRRAGRIFLRIRRPRTAGDSGHSGGGMTGA